MNRFEPLDKDTYGNPIPTERGWFLADGGVKMSEKGSMTGEIIPSFIRHLNLYVRKFLPGDVFYSTHTGWSQVKKRLGLATVVSGKQLRGRPEPGEHLPFPSAL